MNDIFSLLLKLISLFAVLVWIYLAPALKEWLSLKIESIDDEQTRKAVKTAVLAAEQCFKAKDPTGEIRHDYVLEELKDVGLTITNRVLDMIEEEVFALGHKKHENGE